MVKSFQDVLAISQEKKVDMRVAAYIRAIDRVAQATMIRGDILNLHRAAKLKTSAGLRVSASISE